MMNSTQAVLASAAVLRIIAWAVGLTAPLSLQGVDTAGYWTLAESPIDSYSAASGRLFSLSLMRPPGYPLLLHIPRAFDLSIVGAALFQVSYAILTIWVLMILTRILVDKKASVIVGWWLAVEPYHVIESSVLLTEIPFSLFLLTAILAAKSAPEGHLELASSGCILGLGTLIRPISLYLPLLVVPFILVWQRLAIRSRISLAAVFLIGFSIPVGGWMIRNWVVSGVAIFSTIQGLNLSEYRAVGAIIEEDGIDVRAARDHMREMVAAQADPGMNPAEFSMVQQEVGFREILDRPVGYIVSVAKGLLRTLFGPGRAHIRHRLAGAPLSGLLSSTLIAASFVSALLATLFAAIGVFRWVQERRWQSLILVTLPLVYLLLIGSGQEAYSRFRLPIIPLLLILASAAIQSMLPRSDEASRGGRLHKRP